MKLDFHCNNLKSEIVIVIACQNFKYLYTKIN